MSDTRIAIACQGGGSHTAFIAGVLKKLLERDVHKHYHIAGFSGTSGGAICALLVWYGMLREAGGMADESVYQRLTAFWKDNTATLYWEKMWNTWVVALLRLQESGAMPQFKVSPYNVSLSWMLDEFTDLSPRRDFFDLKGLLTRYVDFEEIPTLMQPASPSLLLGAVNVLSGDFKVFDSRQNEISAEAVLASTAIPTLSKAVHINREAYWDGLFSENPPISAFVEGVDVQEKPDEIWIIQINPSDRRSVPESIGDILDRRNELAGNLSLHQEIGFIQTVNRWIGKGFTNAHRQAYKPIILRRVMMSHELIHRLDSVSKMDRSPLLIERLMADGEHQGELFLDDLDAHIIPG
jgi:NTE family protein